MSIHIGAGPGEIASTVLLPGDPLRARHIAETMLDDAFCFNEVRGMLGYTGRYGDKRISVMGTGMGMPSLSIYVHELITEYDVQAVIRVGTCGALQPHLKVGDIVLAMTASTDSQINRLRFGGMEFAPCASFRLLLRAYEAAQRRGIRPEVGGIFSADLFYSDEPNRWQRWREHGVLACEMESSRLYTMAAKFGVDAVSVLTVSDSVVTGETSTAEQRERGFSQMAEIALEIAP